MQIENVFPVPLAFIDVPQNVVDNSLSIAKAFMEENNWYNLRHYGQTITTYHKDIQRNYLGNYDNLLGEYVSEEFREYLEIQGFNPLSDLRIESWLNLNPPDTHHSTHQHFGCFMGGVFWLDAPENSGNFVVHDPVGIRTQNVTQYTFANKKTTMYNNEIYSVRPMSGQMLMFPSWLPHQVKSNESSENRISIAFNVWMV